jgi:hypothetical protein
MTRSGGSSFGPSSAGPGGRSGVRFSVGFVAVVGVSMLTGTTMLVGTRGAAAAKPTFSQTPADYLAATVGGRKVVLDATSSGGGTLGSCGIADATVAFAYNGNLAQEAFGGVWNCPVDQPNQFGTGFVTGLDAGTVPSGTPKLIRRELLTALAVAAAPKLTLLTHRDSRFPGPPNTGIMCAWPRQIR